MDAAIWALAQAIEDGVIDTTQQKGPAVRFRKKPVVVSAVRWTGDNQAELVEFTGRRFETINPLDRGDDDEMTAQVFDVLHSTWVSMRDGDWVIRGVAGEFYPCANDVFRDTYEAVQEEEDTDDRISR